MAAGCGCVCASLLLCVCVPITVCVCATCAVCVRDLHETLTCIAYFCCHGIGDTVVLLYASKKPYRFKAKPVEMLSVCSTFS